MLYGLFSQSVMMQKKKVNLADFLYFILLNECYIILALNNKQKLVNTDVILDIAAIFISFYCCNLSLF